MFKLHGVEAIAHTQV